MLEKERERKKKKRKKNVSATRRLRQKALYKPQISASILMAAHHRKPQDALALVVSFVHDSAKYVTC